MDGYPVAEHVKAFLSGHAVQVEVPPVVKR
jgi:hypothetical protein